jgi:signal-transduction protein with cAMP-binding, CBS, and nucleotidyltransferase domain
VEALREAKIMGVGLCHDLLEAYGFIQDLRLRQHAKAILSQTRYENLIKTRELSKLDLVILKESFKVVSAFQKFLMSRYNIRRAGGYNPL